MRGRMLMMFPLLALAAMLAAGAAQRIPVHRPIMPVALPSQAAAPAPRVEIRSPARFATDQAPARGPHLGPTGSPAMPDVGLGSQAR